MLTRSLLTTVALALLGCAPAAAAPVTVNLRVEGATQTLYEGLVATDAHPVDGGDGTGPQVCDGTNEGANASAGPTFMGALDDGIRASGQTWFGTFGDFGISDFFVRRIGPDSDSGSTFWYQVRNQRSNQIGPCQQRIAQGDQVLWALSGFDANFNGDAILELTAGRTTATVGEGVPVTVRQYDANGNATPAAGAAVQGQTAGADGKATIAFDSPGVKRFKATKTGAIRSNAVEVCVEAPGSGSCSGFTPSLGSTARDTTKPRGRLTSPRSGKRYRRGPRLLKGIASDEGGVKDVRLRLNWIGSNGCQYFEGAVERFSKRSHCKRTTFFSVGDDAVWSYLLPKRLAPGRYTLTLKVVDRGLNSTVTRIRFTVLG